MMKSMTGYGRCRSTVNGRDITVEIKAVNSRYFECGVKISRAYLYLEDKIKSHIQTCGISRGKVDVFVSVELPQGEGITLSLDTAYAESYINALKQLSETFGLKDDISTMRVAQNRDIFTQKKPDDDIEGEWDNVRGVLETAIASFDAARCGEGERLKADIYAKRKRIESLVEKIEQTSESTVKAYESRLYTRLKEVLSENDITLNESRIVTECAIFADRVAIDEEIVRLKSHMTAFDEYLGYTEPVGRKLDFQLQEMNREVNTIGSKCQNSDVTKIVVEIKSELEKIREQIQNIE